MIALALSLLLAASPQSADETDQLRAQLRGLEDDKRRLEGALRERDELLGAVRSRLAGLREDVESLKERLQPAAASFLAAPPVGSERLGVARTAVFAPRIEVASFRRHDTLYLKLRRIEATRVQTVAELELAPDASSVALPLDQSGAVYLVEWTTSAGHVFDLALRDGASELPVATVPVKEQQAEGRFVLVGFKIE